MLNKLNALHSGEQLIILFDDLNSQIGYLMGMAEYVSGESVNYMTHFGKGLVYVCIPADKAKQLNLPLIGDGTEEYKDFTVSVDFKTNTTGISAFERSDTIKAFIQEDTIPDDFIRPGHTFPLVSKERNLLDRNGIAEVAVFISGKKSKYPVSYVCEILNADGEVANYHEVIQLGKLQQLPVISFSEIIHYYFENTPWLHVSDRQYLDDSKRIAAFTVNNKLANENLKIFIRQDGECKNNIIFYSECPFGDLLDSNTCGCHKHFKDYYIQLLNEDIDAIVLENNQPSYKDIRIKDFIDKQITRFIEEDLKSNKRKMKV
jgi:3,4-dihydroxy 2-butanone 4-phosphate synthase / GTP cyclohydrolase II